jgi:hypothetical protein
MKKFIVAGLVAASALFAGCGGNDCEEAADRIADKFEECGIQTTGGGDGGNNNAECTEATGEASQKLADCIEKATCDDVKSGAYFTKC